MVSCHAVTVTAERGPHNRGQVQRAGPHTLRAMALEPIGTLHPYPGNARRGDVGMIVDGLERFGQYRAIIVNTGKQAPELANTVLCGNHTLEAAKQLGWTEIDVQWVDYDQATAHKLVLWDNKTQDAATYDVEALVDMLTEYPDLTGTGFTRDELDTLLESLETPGEDDVPDMPADEEPTQWNLLVECDSEDAAKLLKTKLTAEGYTCGLA